MTLGLYWYFKAPEGIYPFHFFEFHAAIGGHANDPAELECTYVTLFGEKIKEEIAELISEYPYAFCILKEEGDAQSIIIGNYELHDYDFLFALEIEKILQKHNATKKAQYISWNKDIIRYKGSLVDYFSYYSFKTKEINYVSTDPKPHLFNASTSAVSFNLSLDSSLQHHFLKDMKVISDKQSFEHFFVYFKQYQGRTYCAVVVTNGRQGLNLQPYRWNDLESYEDAILEIVAKYNCTWGIGSTSPEDFDNKYPHGPGTTLEILAGNPDLC